MKPEPRSHDFLYQESKRAKLEREKEERKRKREMEIEFDPDDLALATVPGEPHRLLRGGLTLKSSQARTSTLASAPSTWRS